MTGDAPVSFLDAARRRADRFDVRTVLVATLTGSSVRRVRDAFGPSFRFVAVGNPHSSYQRGLVYHQGTDDETRRQLETEGIAVILADQGPFQAINIGGQPYDVGGDVPQRIWRGAHKTFADWDFVPHLDQVISKGLSGQLDPLWVISHTLGSLLGDGPAVCVEISLIAADSGHLSLAEHCMAIDCPNPRSRAPDAALVLRPQKTARLLSGLRIKDLLLSPRPDDHWFADKPLWPDG